MSSVKKFAAFFPLACLLAALPVFSQEAPPPDDETLYVIAGFEFDITGHTRINPLIHNAELKEGEEFRGEAALKEYIRDKTQTLVNQRVLKDNAEITYSVGEMREDGAYPVIINIHVEDSWNIIALPYPKYSTNTGLEFVIKARDYNFLGTMNPLRIDLGYEYDENNRSSFFLGIDSNTPFKAFGYTWNFRFSNIFSYRPQVSEPYYYQNVTGLSMELPLQNTTLTFGFEEYFNLNEENADRDKPQYGSFQNGLYMSSKMYTRWEIPTGIRVSRYGELTYNPGIAAIFNHELPEWQLQDIRRGPFVEFSHSLKFERIDWHSNYREGLSSSVSNSYTYDFYRMGNEQDPWSISFTAGGTGHFIISNFFGISSRLQYRQWFYHEPDYYDTAGDIIRGIADRALSADYMMSLNMDFPLRALVFTPSKWFNTRKLSLFDFELHISPVFDVALYHDPRTQTSFDVKNIVTGGGLEFIVFPYFMRSLYARLSFAWNLREIYRSGSFKLPDGQNREISFIIGHFY